MREKEKKKGKNKMSKIVNSGVAYRPLAGTKGLTTKKPEEHPQDIVFCLNRHIRIVPPKELIDAYPAVYGEDSGIDAMLIANIPCNASQLLAREIRKEGDRKVVIVVYGYKATEARLIVRLDNTRKEKLTEYLENHPHQKSVDLIDKFVDENPDIAEFEGGKENGK